MMIYKPWFSILFEVTSVIIKVAIIGVVIWMGYLFIKGKRKGTMSNDNLNTNPSMYVRVFGVDIKKRIINKVFLLLGALPLLAYPMVIASNAMALLGLYMCESLLGKIPILLYMIITSTYILTYIICFAFYFKKRDENILVTSIPLIHEAVILIIIKLL